MLKSACMKPKPCVSCQSYGQTIYSFIIQRGHSGLKGETPEKNVSDNPSMDSFTKIYIDSEKLWPKIRELRLFELTLQNDAKKP